MAEENKINVLVVNGIDLFNNYLHKQCENEKDICGVHSVTASVLEDDRLEGAKAVTLVYQDMDLERDVKADILSKSKLIDFLTIKNKVSVNIIKDDYVMTEEGMMNTCMVQFFVKGSKPNAQV